MSTTANPLRLDTRNSPGVSDRLREVALWSTSRAAAGLQRLMGNRRADGFGILMYHRVCDAVPGVAPPTWNVTPKQLRRQLSGLLARGFEAWPLAQLIDARRNLRAIPSNVFAVTFDDGYRNNLTAALPILRELQVPATIFLATKYLDSQAPFPFDDWPARGAAQVPTDHWQPLTTDECRELATSGLIELAAHTHSHERFVGRADAFRRDLTVCLEVLNERFGIKHPSFAFPYGAYDADMLEIVRRLGATCALITAYRRVECTDDEFGWSRFNVWNGDSATVLAAKLSGWYATAAHVRNAALAPVTAIGRAARRQSNGRASTSARTNARDAAEAVSRI
jgi:peptidoglycan/xylan/chitin deacetylase (PgdA/CDA1 family)